MDPLIDKAHGPALPPLFREDFLPQRRISSARMAIIEGNRMKSDLLRSYCTNYWGFDVVAVEKTARSGIAMVTQDKPELVLAAVPLPDLRLADFVEQLRLASPASKLILLIASYNEYLIHTLSATEYHGLVFESVENLASLGAAIERVRSGARFVSTPILQCQSALRSTAGAFPQVLSKRLEEVLICIAHSLSDDEIGLQLGFTPGTAQCHRRTLMGKLNIHSTPKLIRYCAEKGFNSVPLPVSRQPATIA